MKKASEGSSSCRLERKTVEKNRRLHMKNLCFKLASLLPSNTLLSKDALTQLDHLDQAAAYIRALQKRVEELKCRKKVGLSSGRDAGDHRGNGGGSGLPVVEIRDTDSTLEVVLVCGSEPNRSLFYDAIAIIEEEGAEVVNASFSTVGDRIFCTIHSQITLARIGLEASRISDRLRELLH